MNYSIDTMCMSSMGLADLQRVQLLVQRTPMGAPGSRHRPVALDGPVRLQLYSSRGAQP